MKKEKLLVVKPPVVELSVVQPSVVTTSTTFSGKTALLASDALNRFLSGYVITVVSVSAYYNAVRQEHIVLLVYSFSEGI